MSNIKILDTFTANQIAAGEVVERPASVVKELCENALDAGASVISVSVQNGGIVGISVVDNGSGMDRDDAKVAFLRHATSKISTVADFDSIKTMGFRGEALASIASVSKVTLKTRQIGSQEGTIVKIEDGNVMQHSSVGCNEGTSILVEYLFYNTPARYKFLKKDSTENSYITDIIERFILARPDVSFRLFQNNQEILHSPGNNDLKSAIFSVYGKQIVDSLIPVSYKTEKLEIEGFIGKPVISRGTRQHQSVFVNNRYIKSKTVSAAIEEAYKTLLMKGKFPFCIININLSPALVDVNVHPQKTEVKFWNDQEIFISVNHALKNVLSNGISIPEITTKEKSQKEDTKSNDYYQYTLSNPDITKSDNGDLTNDNSNKKQDLYTANIGDNTSKDCDINVNNKKDIDLSDNSDKDIDIDIDIDINNKKDIDIYVNDKKDTVLNDINGKNADNDENLNDYKNDVTKNVNLLSNDLTNSESNSNLYKIVSDKQVVNTFKEDNNNVYSAKSSVDYEGDSKNNYINELANARYLGSLFHTYLLFEVDENLIMIDQHAAHERILFEKLLTRYNNKSPIAQQLLTAQQSLTTQQLLIAQQLLTPELIELTMHEIVIVKEEINFLSDIGYDCEIFGAQTILLRTIPNDSSASDITYTFKSVIDTLVQNRNHPKQEVIESTLYTIACKAAIKAKENISDIEIKHLISELQKIPNPTHCPHGRPVLMKMSQYEIEKHFKRIV